MGALGEGGPRLLGVAAAMMRRSRSTYVCGCVLVGDEGPRDEANRWENTHPLLCPVHRAIWAGKSPVVEPGHDEQTEALRDCADLIASDWGDDNSVLQRARAVLEGKPWQPDPRTVAAVVEALRDQADRGEWEPYWAPLAADFIEQRFKPSAPGGGNA